MTRHEFCVYRCYAADGELLYIGATSAGLDRLRSHQRTARWWQSVAGVRIDHHDTFELALAAEREAIAALQPRFNVLLKRLPKPPRSRSRPEPEPRRLPTEGWEIAAVDPMDEAGSRYRVSFAHSCGEELATSGVQAASCDEAADRALAELPDTIAALNAKAAA